MPYEPESTQPGGRRVPRPKTVEPCPRCGEARGANYHDCPDCYQAIESILLADWQALLDQEGILAGSPEEELLARVVLDEFGRHPWTVVDTAMTRLRCAECSGELGSRYPSCGECGRAFGSSIAAEFDATANEHALHVGRYVLRYPEIHSQNAVSAWKLTIPRILTGWLPSTPEAQRAMDWIKKGRIDEIRKLIQRVDQEIERTNQG